MFSVSVFIAFWWVDAGTSLIRPIDPWIDHQHSFQMVMLRRPHQYPPKIASGVIYASRPGLPLLKAAWEEMVPRLLSRIGTKDYRDFGSVLFRDLMSSRTNLSVGLHSVSQASLQGFLKIGSTRNILPSDQHWMKRQESEPLYLSGE